MSVYPFEGNLEAEGTFRVFSSFLGAIGTYCAFRLMDQIQTNNRSRLVEAPRPACALQARRTERKGGGPPKPKQS
jgi:hypothetical protein